MTHAIARGEVDQVPVCVTAEPDFTVGRVGIVVTSYTGFLGPLVSALPTARRTDQECDAEAMAPEALHPDERRMLRDALDEPGARMTLDELKRSLDAG